MGAEIKEKAIKVLKEGGVPIGAVLVKDGKIIGRERNKSARGGSADACQRSIIFAMRGSLGDIITRYSILLSSSVPLAIGFRISHGIEV